MLITLKWTFRLNSLPHEITRLEITFHRWHHWITLIYHLILWLVVKSRLICGIMGVKWWKLFRVWRNFHTGWRYRIRMVGIIPYIVETHPLIRRIHSSKQQNKYQISPIYLLSIFFYPFILFEFFFSSTLRKRQIFLLYFYTEMLEDRYVENTYKKVTQIQHILLRPDSYVGSAQPVEENMWVVEGDTFQMRKIKYVPGLYKIFDEILVNAADNMQRDHRMTKIDVSIDEETGYISVYNDGKSIPVQIHQEHKIYVAELIFGHLLTSSNYNDQEKKVTGGRNGFGAKLANIFSSHFLVQTADGSSRKLLKVEWTKNMSQMKAPEILSYQGKNYTRISFLPDFKKFGIKSLSKDIVDLFKKRVYDLGGILKCKVYLNNKLLALNSFEDYAKLYCPQKEQETFIKDHQADSKRWQVILTKSQGQFQQVSFVNGISTQNGGTHVNHVVEQIVQNLLPSLKKKVKDIDIKPFQIKSQLKIFVNCLIQNPSFSSQTKDTLTLSASKFGSSYQVSDKMIKDIMKSGIPERILNQVRAKENNKIDRQLKKLKNNTHRLVIPKLQDANLAGRAPNCTLILTEGDSAKTLAMSGIEHLGRDLYGVYPLRGKVINVREMTNKMVMENYELSSIVKIVGLTFGKTYTDTESLRYSSIMIMADQDIDGSHIKGLLLNFFQTFWPSLCKIKGFIKQFITPLIRCKRGTECVDFFSTADYEAWKRENSQVEWKVKYYKGLGTSTHKEAQQYFSNLSKHQLTFNFQDEEDHEILDLLFLKRNTDKRKAWLQGFDPTQTLNYRNKQVKVEEFVNREFIHFSSSDNDRSIPSIVDGLKPSQRKILYACFKRNLRNEIKVAQLAGYIAEHSAYHHGEVSLCSTIIGMAQNYVGSNNVNLLEPIGQFGTRHMNGKDHASPRYIFTNLNPLTRYLFNEADDHIVQYLDEEGQSIQPRHYYPILPLVLINGCDGIGTGWSTNIQAHRVKDVIEMMRERLKGNYKFITIGWENFTGEVKLQRKGCYSIKGKYKVQGDQVTISQIPIGKSIRDYKSFLEGMVKSLENQNPYLEDFREYHCGDRVQFKITFVEGKQPYEVDMEKFLKLQSKTQQSNMTLFNSHRKIKKYETIADIMEQFYQERLLAYEKRKRYLTSKFQREAEILSEKVEFINGVMAGKFSMMGSKQAWIRHLSAQKYKRFQDFTKVQSTKIPDSSEQEDKQYNYLLTMPIWSFCKEKVVQLEKTLEQVKRVVNYYEDKTEVELWEKDLNEFEEAWDKYQSGKQVKENKDAKTKPAPVKRTYNRLQGKRREPLSAQQSEKQIKQNPTRKKLKREAQMQKKQTQHKPKPKQTEQKEQPINSILSKYLSPSQQGGTSLEERIKARIEKGDQNFMSSYKEAKNSDEKPKDQQKDDQFDWLL